MDSSATKDIVKNAWKAFATRDAAQIESVFTEDARWFVPPGNATAVALGHADAQVLDRPLIVQFLAHEFAQLFVRDVKSTPRSLIAEGGRYWKRASRPRWPAAATTTTSTASSSK